MSDAMNQPPVRAVSAALGLYPTFDSLQQAIDWAAAQLPINNRNTLLAVLGVYHNSLLRQVDATRSHY